MTTCCPCIKYSLSHRQPLPIRCGGEGRGRGLGPLRSAFGRHPSRVPLRQQPWGIQGMRAGPRSPVSLGAAEPPRGPFCPLRGCCCRLPWSTPALPYRRQPPLRGGAPAPRGGHRCAPRLRPLPARGRLRLRPRPCGGRPVRRRRRVRPCFAPGSHAPPSAPLRAPRHLGGAGALTRGLFPRAGLQPGPPQPPQAAAL